MHRIDSSGAVAGAWSDGNPGTGTLGTKIDDDYMNAVQEELCGFIEAAGIALVKGDNTQLRDAVDAFIAVEAAARTSADGTHAGLTNPHGATSAATASRIVLRDANGRAQFADPGAAEDAATKAYVDALAATLTTSAMTLGANWALGVGNVNRVGKRAGVVTFTVESLVASNGSAAWTALGTLPVGFRPGEIVYGYGVITDAGTGTMYGAEILVRANGVVLVNYYDDGTNLAVPFTVAAGDSVRFSVTFVAEN